MRTWIGIVALVCALAGCSGNGAGRAEAPAPPAAGCPPTTGEPPQGSGSPSANAGSSIELGPSPEIDARKAARAAAARQGTPLVLSGTVYTADCRRAVGATINVWQTDARGIYGPGHRSGNPRCCYLQGTLQTDPNGRYTIETIKPGHYRGAGSPPPAHIHMEVLYRGHGPLTEVFFEGDPYLGSGEPDGYVLALREEPGVEGKRLLGRFDIVLGAE